MRNILGAGILVINQLPIIKIKDFSPFGYLHQEQNKYFYIVMSLYGDENKLWR